MNCPLADECLEKPLDEQKVLTAYRLIKSRPAGSKLIIRVKLENGRKVLYAEEVNNLGRIEITE